MAKVSSEKRFKTTPRKRENAQVVRARRSAAGKPQPVVVDEALSAALKTVQRAVERGGLTGTTTVKDVTDALVERAASHLVDRRGFAPEPSREAIRERLSRPRTYRTIKPSTA